jgi:multisubunit Na+/H+ antiporter MnhB subunit
MQLCVRVGTAFMGMSVPLLALTRGIITTSVALLVICASRLPALAREDWLLVLGRGAIGASAMVCKVRATAAPRFRRRPRCGVRARS